MSPKLISSYIITLIPAGNFEPEWVSWLVTHFLDLYVHQSQYTGTLIRLQYLAFNVRI